MHVKRLKIIVFLILFVTLEYPNLLLFTSGVQLRH